MLNVYGTSDGSFTRLKVKRDEVEELPARYNCLWVDFVEESLEEVVKLLERLFSERVELLRQLDLVDHSDRELAEAVSLSDLALTVRLSRIMTLLTVIATVLLLPNTVATILGIPSLPIPSTAWGIVGALIIISGLLPTIYAYKKGWFKP